LEFGVFFLPTDAVSRQRLTVRTLSKDLTAKTAKTAKHLANSLGALRAL
jgi:hypothetical protein